MADSKDIILNELVQKKKSLLDDLLALSIRSACDIAQEDSILKHRSNLLIMLEKNDRAITTREKQTGIKATSQEQELYIKISTLLSSIKDNNQITMLKLEEAEKAFEAEKSELGLGKKLSSYVVQTRTMNQNRLKMHPGQAKTSRIKGTL